jgi:hypothetical protein
MHRSSALLMSLAATAVIGCGSTGAHSAGAPVATSVATAPSGAAGAYFIAAADRICRTLRSQQSPLNARSHALTREDPETRRALLALLRQSVAFARAADARLQALQQPRNAAATIDRLLRGYDHEAEEVTSYAEALSKKEPEKQRFAAGSLERTTAADGVLARSLGLMACAAATGDH